MKVTNNNYPTPFAYTLGTMVWIYKLFADPHNFNEFWSNTNLVFLTISKLVPILADFGIATLILYIGKNAKRFSFPTISLSVFGLSFYELLSIFYLLNPVSLIDGALWGQVDSLGVFLFLTSLLFLLKKQPFWTGLVFMLAMMTKLQNMIYGPIFFLFIWQTAGFTGLIQAISGGAVGFFGLNIEFLMTHNMDRVLASLTENYDYFPWMSLHAYNLWWIVAHARGMTTSDKLTVVGLLNAKTVGLLLFSSFYLFAVIRQLWKNNMSVLLHAQGGIPFRDFVTWPRHNRLHKKKNGSGFDETRTRYTDQSTPLIQSFLENLIIVNAAFFLFQTQSHDRYAFPLSVFLLLWAPFFVSNYELPASPTGGRVTSYELRITRYHFKLFTIYYLLFTIFYFYNLHTAFAVNYPQNAILFLSTLTQPFFTIGTAIVLLLLFFVFLFTLVRRSIVTRYMVLGTSIICIGVMALLNRSLITRNPIPLTTFTPFISEQAYGTRQTNISVQSTFGGPYKWTRLSVQYLFYRNGIGTHANSKQVFHINRLFSKLTTDYGIDTESGTKASAIFEIRGDDKVLFRSEKMGRFDLPRHAEIDISGVNNLTLSTTDAGDGNYDDHTDWLNPTLWP